MEKPITPTRLAAEIGISVPYASQILSGARTPSPGIALRAFRLCGVRVGSLVSATDDEIAVLHKFSGSVGVAHEGSDTTDADAGASGKSCELAATAEARS